jgi:hypothetical protein
MSVRPSKVTLSVATPADVLGFHRTTKGYLQTLSSAAPKNVVKTMVYKFRTVLAES